jgi:hypothetical protein
MTLEGHQEMQQTELPQKLAQALRIDIEAKRASQSAIGRLIGISQQAVSKWLEKGVPLQYAPEIAEHLGPDSKFAEVARHETMTGETVPGDLGMPTTVRKTIDRPPPPGQQVTERSPMTGLRNALPEQYKNNVEVPIGPSKRFVLDYLSDRLALEVKLTSANANEFILTVSHASHQIQFARALLGDTPPTRRKYVVAVIFPETRPTFAFLEAVHQLHEQCAALDIVLLMAGSIAELAEYIAEFESTP